MPQNCYALNFVGHSVHVSNSFQNCKGDKQRSNASNFKK